MKLNAAMTIVVVGGVAVWLAADAMTGTRDATQRTPERASPIDARGQELVGEVARLHERLAPVSAPLQPGRNLFSFNAPRPRPESVVKPVLSEALPVAPLPTPPPPFKLVGIAEDRGPGGPIRTAIISAPGQGPFLVKEGQNVTLRYQVTRIAADVVELQDLGDHSVLRLALK
jgi:hypothetical protein